MTTKIIDNTVISASLKEITSINLIAKCLEQFQFYLKNKIHLLKNIHDPKYEIAIQELNSVLARVQESIAEDKKCSKRVTQNCKDTL